MGCKLGKLASSAAGASERGRESPPPPPATDPRLPLNAKQKYLLTASWKAIAKAIEPTGVYMFVKLFEENEELLNMFESFKHLKTKEDQQTSLELNEHAQKVMNTLDEGIQSLDKVDNFLAFLHQVGATHTKIAGFKREYFWKIESPFLAAMRETLHDRYTENVENIYKLTIKFIIETLIDGFDKAKGESSEPGDKGKS